MRTVALEDIYVNTVLTFCENPAELGCPQDEPNVDMWFRNLSREEQYKVAEKMMDIEDRDAKRFKEDELPTK